jgi:hypothetical protein
VEARRRTRVEADEAGASESASPLNPVFDGRIGVRRMSTKLAFRCLLLVEAVLSVVVLPVTVALSSALPSDLTLYLERLPTTTLEGPAALLLPAFEVAALLGLFFFVRGARELYVLMVGVSLSHAVAEELPAVLPTATYVAVQIERMITGAIVGLAYCSPIAGLLSLRRPREENSATESVATPSNNEMRRTKPAQAMEFRR